MKEVVRGIGNILRDSRVRTLLSLFFLFIGGVVLALINLGYTVALILSLVLKPTFHIEEIKFLEWGKISGKNIELIYKNQKVVIAPTVYIEYDIKGPLRDWLKKITVENPEVLIERESSEVNIVEAFATGGSNKSGTGVPIGIIEVKDGNLTFRDISYEIPIEKQLQNVQGYVEFDKIKGIDLIFSGKDGEEKASYSFNNLIENYEMNIKLENIEINTTLLQYGYYYEPVQYREGEVDLDLTISPRGLEGYANLRDAVIEYSDFSEPATNINGKVDFLGERIVIDADFKIFNEKKKFDLDLDFNKGMESRINLGKMSLSQLKNYKLLKDVPLEKIPADVNNLSVYLRLDEDRNFSVNVDYLLSDVEMGIIQLKNPKGGLTYSEEEVKFNFLEAQATINGVEKNIHLSGKFQNEEMEIKYQIGHFLGEIDLFFSEEDLSFKSKEGIFKGEGKFNYESQKISVIGEKSEAKEIPEPLIIYDIKNRNLELLQGEWKLKFLENITLKFIGEGENNEIYFKEIGILQEEERVLTGEGELDLNKLYYRFYYESENFVYSYPMDGEFVNFRLYSIGDLRGTGKEFILDSEGTIESLIYGKYEFNGLKYSFRLNKDNIQILNVSNNILTINGNYNIIQKELNLNYKVENLENQYLKIDAIQFHILEGTGKIKKNSDETYGELNLTDAKIYPLGTYPIEISGKFSYENGLLDWENITVNKNSRISGHYNVETFDYSLTAEIFETDLSKYIQDKNFKYKFIGRFSAKGKGKTIDAKGNFTLDDLFFKGEEIGKLKGSLNYNGEDFTKGILEVEKVDFLRDNQSLFEIKGELDLKSEMINLSLNEKEIDVEALYKKSPFKGRISIKSDLKGSFKNPNFSVDLSSQKISVENFNFNNINIGIKGNFEKIFIDDLSFNYLENRMEAKGYYDIKDSQYLVNLESKEINLNFLNLLTKDRFLKDIEGEGVMDLTLSNLGNSGTFQGDKISFLMDESRIKVENINFDISLSGKKIEIKNFIGKINDGTGEVTGYFNVPSLLEINQGSEFYTKLDYDLLLKLKEVNYNLGKELALLLNSEIKFSENKISGKIDFVEGNITGIPGIGDGISIIGVLKKIILTAIPVRFGTKESIDEEYEQQITETQEIGIDLDFKITKGIELDIPNIWNILEDIKGKLTGGGKLSGQLNKLNFLGQVELGRGEFILGDNDFKILTGRLVFNDSDDYIPNVNPILTFEAKSPFENTEISLIGELKSLNFRIKNSNESSSGSLASLFNSQERYNEENNRVGPSANIIRNLLGAQLTNSFLSPTARVLKNIFGLSKLRITADITDTFANLEDENRKNDQTMINFGIKIIAEDSIYKDKIFAVADARITGARDQEDKRSGYSGYNNFDRYSTGLQYRYTEGQSLGIGVQNEGEKGYGSENQKIKKEKLNYYIDFKIEKKYDSLMEIYTDTMKSIFKKR